MCDERHNQARRKSKQKLTAILNNYPRKIFPPFFFELLDGLDKLFFMLPNELHDKFYGVNGLQAKEDLSITAWWGLKRDSPQRSAQNEKWDA